MSSTVSSATGLPSSNAERAEHRRGLYLGMAIAMLAIVLIGFSPTFFLFWLFDAPVRPYPFSHGIILTAWYVLFLVQAWLAFRGRVRSHRQLGLIAATIGYVAMLTAAFATLNS